MNGFNYYSKTEKKYYVVERYIGFDFVGSETDYDEMRIEFYNRFSNITII